jgi:hypothetical protein
MIPLECAKNAGDNAHSGERAALGAAVGAENALIDPDLQAIIDTWSALSEAVKKEILAMVDVVEARGTNKTN